MAIRRGLDPISSLSRPLDINMHVQTLALDLGPEKRVQHHKRAVVLVARLSPEWPSLVQPHLRIYNDNNHIECGFLPQYT